LCRFISFLLHNFFGWLKNINPNEIRKFPLIYESVEQVKKFRELSKRPQTLKAAKFPYLFGEERHPESDYLAIPKVSSENRIYIPITFLSIVPFQSKSI
jgi:hypothetical protein